MIDTTPDLDLSVDAGPSINGHGANIASHPLSPLSSKRTLLLAPPSIAAHEDKLHALFATFDRSTSDLQMLDRLSAGLVTLPAATYDLVLLLTDPDGGLRAEATALMTRDVYDKIVPAMRPGATLSSQDGIPVDEREAVLAGLISDAKGGFAKPEYAEEEAVALPVRFGKKKVNTTVNGGANGVANGGANGLAHSSAGPAVASVTVPVDGKATTLDMKPASTVPAGVGFVELDLGDYESGDELLDEDDILTDAERNRPIQQPPECAPKPGQRRKACKDCTCGLAERMAEQDKKRAEQRDKNIKATIKLASEDLSEMDFTVQGKKGSCNSCSLGDAFRCDGCPYIGLPPFKPGEEVTILNNAIQL